MKQFFPAQPVSVTELEIKHSRFITYVAHTPDYESAETFLAGIREQHKKANHNCWARIAGSRDDLKTWNCSDDGEPKGTAGRPMLNVLEHSELCEISVVVTRYFGGIKLGAGGLVRAYSQAVQEAIAELKTIERIKKTDFCLTLPHHLVGDIEHLLSQCQVDVEQRNWSHELEIQGKGSKDELLALRQHLDNFKHQVHYKDSEVRW